MGHILLVGYIPQSFSRFFWEYMSYSFPENESQGYPSLKTRYTQTVQLYNEPCIFSTKWLECKEQNLHRWFKPSMNEQWLPGHVWPAQLYNKAYDLKSKQNDSVGKGSQVLHIICKEPGHVPFSQVVQGCSIIYRVESWHLALTGN